MNKYIIFEKIKFLKLLLSRGYDSSYSWSDKWVELHIGQMGIVVW